MTTASADAATAMKTVFEAWRLRQPGEIRRNDYRWDFDLGLRDPAWGPSWKGYLALHRDGSGQVDGYIRYHADEKWEHRQPRSVVVVDELHALTEEAYAALWRYLVEIDWAGTVKAERRSPSDRLPWLLTNFRAAEVSDVGDGLWVRLFDVPRALEARRYEREGSLVLEVIDKEARGGRLRVLLDAGPDGATCRATDRPADLTLDVGALGAAFLGGTRLGDAVLAGGADEHRAGTLAQAERLFRTHDEPWSSTFF
jgi:predicted acetyltransferase